MERIDMNLETETKEDDEAGLAFKGRRTGVISYDTTERGDMWLILKKNYQPKN